jgi:hypothetical protein
MTTSEMSSSSTAPATDEQPLFERPDWVRRFNAIGSAAGGAAELVPLDVDAMCESAKSSAGLDDFGDVDGDWLGRLRALTAAIDDTARLHAVGRAMTRGEILRCLRTRLALAEDARRRPGVLGEVITTPVIVTGPARSGTSLLFELLDLDPTLRGPNGGEIFFPGPTDDAGQRERLRIAECEYEFWNDVQPEFRAVHDMRAVYPQECIHVQMPSFSGAYWPMVAEIPRWAPDMVAAMQFHRRVLQSLQHERPSQGWVLKTPVYLSMLDLVFAIYPDAWVIHTHRDPLKTMPSGASTLANVRWLRSDHVGARGIGGDDRMSNTLLNLISRRANGELPDRIVDVHFADLMADPVTAVSQAYESMGRDLTGPHADAIRSYVANRPQGTFGKHAYSADSFGIDEQALRERMRPYTDHYGVRLEVL